MTQFKTVILCLYVSGPATFSEGSLLIQSWERNIFLSFYLYLINIVQIKVYILSIKLSNAPLNMIRDINSYILIFHTPLN